MLDLQTTIHRNLRYLEAGPPFSTSKPVEVRPLLYPGFFDVFHWHDRSACWVYAETIRLVRPT
jgi:hypothetical protein